MNVLHRVKVLLWGETPANPKEAKLLLKMDWFILSFICLVYWCNYLDRLNLSNAYVSGMKEDLNLHGNQFNVINTMFTVGYVIGLIPHNLILLKVRSSIWLSFCCFAWGLLTLGMYKAQNFQTLVAVRFFQGIFESAIFTGCHLILSLWYTETELTKRSAVFTCSGLLGNIFSSTLQSAIYTNLNGKNGLAGWRWLFIIDFIITVPIALYGFLFFPDTPHTSKSFYFTNEELELARARKPPVANTTLDWTIIKRVVGRWRWYLFSLLFVMGGENESFATNSLFSLYLTYFGYSIPDRNHFPMGVYAMGILFTFTFALYVDGTGGRYHYRVAIFIGIIMLISAIMLLANPTKHSVVFAAHYLSGAAYAGQATFFAWANIVCSDDLPERAIVLASMNMFSNAVNAWWSLIFYGADTAPRFTKGAIAMICTVVASVVIACVMRYIQLQDERLRDNTTVGSDIESNGVADVKVESTTNVMEIDSL